MVAVHHHFGSELNFLQGIVVNVSTIVAVRKRLGKKKGRADKYLEVSYVRQKEADEGQCQGPLARRADDVSCVALDKKDK